MNILRLPSPRYLLAPITALLVIAGAPLPGEPAEAKDGFGGVRQQRGVFRGSPQGFTQGCGDKGRIERV